MQNSLATRRAKGSFLLDQQHGETFFLIQPKNDVANFVDDVGLNSFCGFVENEQIRLEDQRAADG